MLDIKLIRNDPKAVEKKLKTKVPEASLDDVVRFDDRIRDIKAKVEQLKARRNEASEIIGQKKRKGEDASKLVEEMGSLGHEIHALDHELQQLEPKFIDALARLPNLPFDDILVSPNPQDNVVVKSWGKKPEFSYPFKNHVELNEALQLFDFARAAKMTGSGWVAYKGMGARLEWALLNYMIDTHIKNGFQQWIPPVVVKKEVLFAAGQLPKFENQQYAVRDGEHDNYLIPTAEVALNGLYIDEILPEEALPLKYMAYTPCFRREAGALGSQERGLIRMHQFNKVEMFAFTRPDQSEGVFQEFVRAGEQLLEGLDLHYRSTLLVTGDMSFAAAKTIDIEVWLPGQNRYYEVSSVSNCTDYQSRRSQVRFKEKGGKPQLVHTLNGSGLATSRLMVAILENNQQADGSVNIPKVLQPYLGGIDRILPGKLPLNLV